MASTTKPIYVGVDDGHCTVNIVTENGSMFSLPSRAKEGRHLIGVKDTDGSSGLYLTEEGLSYTVNEHINDPSDTRFKEYPKSGLNRVLVHHGLHMAGLGGKDVRIVTGLPVSYYYRADAKPDGALIAAKRENLSKGVTSGSTPMARIAQNHVTSEAIAAYYDFVMDMRGEETPDADEIQRSYVGVIDIGGKTTDCAVVLPGGSNVDPARSGSSDTGVLLLNDKVRSLLMQRFDLDNINNAMVDGAIRTGVARIMREDHDVSAMINEAKEQLFEQIMAGVRSKIGSGRDLDYILLVGGGSIVMREQLTRTFQKNGTYSKHPEFANAFGMLKYGKYVLGGEA